MTAKEAAIFWREGANDALDSAQKLFDSKKYHHALFFCHLAAEKALKARYIEEKRELPPYTHDLVLIASKLDVSFNSDQRKELAEINTFNIAARYQEDRLDLYQKATPAYAADWIKRTNLILQSLLP